MNNNDNQQYLDNLRHSAAHLLAAAVMEIWPNAKRTIGPAIENGFYFDFDFGDDKVSEMDFAKIDNKMRELVKSWKSFEREEVSAEEAKKRYAGNEYKIELIEEFAKEGQTLTFYKSGNYEDLCRGGHVEHPDKELKYFKLLSVAGAYWRGDEKNKMLTRIYGTIWPSKEELDAYLERMEKAKLHDHRKLGQELDLFTFSDLVGKGLPLWTPKGATIRRELERFIVDEELRRGYLHVNTPDIALLDLYKTSGHYPYYKDTMYAPIKIDEDEFMLRPMTCPHHFEIYKSKPRSYKELPMRLAELAQLYRYEKSGELTGLMRVRTFCLADAHIIASKDQAKSEINGVLDLIVYVAGLWGLKQGEDYHFRLSLGDRADDKKYYKDDAAWDFAENVLRDVLKERGDNFVEAEHEAAFYGPKIDVQMNNIHGKEETAFTVQYDFVMPKRFELKYINAQGQEEEPIVIHRSSIGAIERIMGFLIEKFGGAFPLWLSPMQVVVVPISQDQDEYAAKVVAELKAEGIRAENWNEAESMQNRIRKAEAQKVPYMLVVGKREAEVGSVAVRKRGKINEGELPLEQFVAKAKKEIAEKALS
jgi:threonyl-tRNA synthetase